jgi:signal transduction histidine kinase
MDQSSNRAKLAEIRHMLNNPLTALLTEAQLLQLEALPEEQKQSVDRIVELCRRTIDAVKQLDSILLPS